MRYVKYKEPTAVTTYDYAKFQVQKKDKWFNIH